MICAKDYIYFLPTYVHTLIIYSFCNIDDLSWGTKNLDAQSVAKTRLNDFKGYKVKFVAGYILINSIAIFLLLIFTESESFRSYFVLSLSYVFTAVQLIQSLCAILYEFKYFIERIIYYIKIKRKYKKSPNQQ